MGALSGRVVVFVLVQPSYVIIHLSPDHRVVDDLRLWAWRSFKAIFAKHCKDHLALKGEKLSNSLRVHKHYNPVVYNVTFDSYYFPWINVHYTYIAWETPNALAVACLILQMVWDQGCNVLWSSSQFSGKEAVVAGQLTCRAATGQSPGSVLWAVVNHEINFEQ